MKGDCVLEQATHHVGTGAHTIQSPLLVADVGGTNVRFGIVTEQTGQLPMVSEEKSFRCQEFNCFEDAMEAYLKTLSLRIDRACVAVAGPVFSGEVEMTNLNWRLRDKVISDRFGLSSTNVINDFVAQAMSVSVCDLESLTKVRSATSVEHAQRVVLGAGTGLGVAALIYTNHWHAVSSEAGHMMYAPHSDLEKQVHIHLKKTFGFVSLERILSGPGLVNVYRAMCEIHGERPKPYEAKDIDEMSRSIGDPMCSAAVEFFWTVLGGCAADLALTFHADGGVFLGGGVLTRMRDQLSKERFNQGYLRNTVKRDYLEALPVFLLDDGETGLEGAAVYATRISG
jgi:glucokinase